MNDLYIRQIKSYIHNRTNSNDIDSILNFLSYTCVLITHEGVKYSGRDELKKYYSIPVNSVPSVSEVYYENNNYYVDLSFAFGLKKIRCYFRFDELIDKINYIEMKNIGFL